MSSPKSLTRTASWWTGILLAWVGVVFFSSTSLAGRTCDQALAAFVSTFVRQIDTGDLYHRWQLAFCAEKSVHVFMFTVFAALLWRTFPPVRGKFLVVLACGSVLGCCSEIAQSFFPDRDPTIRDALINMTGTAIGAAMGLLRTRGQRNVTGPDSVGGSGSVSLVTVMPMRG